MAFLFCACREIIGPTILPTPVPGTTPTVIIRVNCGRAADCYWCGSISGHTDSQGRYWSQDQPYTAGIWGYVNGDPGTNSGNIVNVSPDSDDTLYQFNRAYTVSNNLTYRFTVPDGQYTVTTHFCETYFSSAGQRVFDIYINGSKVRSNIDIIAAAGGQMRAIWYSNDVTVASGQIEITAIATAGDAGLISGIEVVSKF